MGGLAAAGLKGEIGGAIAGVGGLVGGVAGGTASWGISFASSQLRTLSARTGALAFDAHFQLHRRQVQQQRPTGGLHGPQLGLEVLEDACVSGVLGLLSAPYSVGKEAVQKGSASGQPAEAGIVVTKGLGRAFVSLIAKVASGVLFLVSKTMEGINVTIVDVRGVLSAGEQKQLRLLRVREPRELDLRPLLLPYPPPWLAGGGRGVGGAEPTAACRRGATACRCRGAHVATPRAAAVAAARERRVRRRRRYMISRRSRCLIALPRRRRRRRYMIISRRSRCRRRYMISRRSHRRRRRRRYMISRRSRCLIAYPGRRRRRRHHLPSPSRTPFLT